MPAPENKNAAAAAALLDALEKAGMSQRELERRLGLADGAVNHWISGRQRPDVHNALQVQRVLGLDVSVWETEAERSKVASLRARVA